MRNYSYVFILLLFVCFVRCAANQPKTTVEQNLLFDNHSQMRIMFYNVENLFDIYDAPEKRDDDFVPDKSYFWTHSKYQRKLNNISKVIVAAGGWKPIDIIGLAEIENRYVLKGLTEQTVLKKYNYNIIHKESGDKRGIDVALLYNPKSFTPILYTAISIDEPENEFFTREILYTKGIALNTDTLHIFVNHWPSRWGGELASEVKRIKAATALRHHVDSVLALNNMAKIIIIGDFNDTPQNQSIKKVLNALPPNDSCTNCLRNLSYSFDKAGTHKYQGDWAILDQIIVSDALLLRKKIYTKPNAATIFYNDFLIEEDNSYMGIKPYRTFIGLRYNGGFSDHLPVILDLFTE